MKSKIIVSKYNPSKTSKPLHPYSVTFNTKDMMKTIKEIGLNNFIEQTQDSMNHSITVIYRRLSINKKK